MRMTRSSKSRITVIRTGSRCVALPLTHRLSSRTGLLKLAELADDALVVYPKSPRQNYADQVLALFRDRDIKPTQVHEVRELQTALGLVAADNPDENWKTKMTSRL